MVKPKLKPDPLLAAVIALREENNRLKAILDAESGMEAPPGWRFATHEEAAFGWINKEGVLVFRTERGGWYIKPSPHEDQVFPGWALEAMEEVDAGFHKVEARQ